MKTICSHTLVRNGMPFIGLVLRQAVPYVNRCLITVSRRSSDGTDDVLKRLKKEYPTKVFIDFENVSSPGELTGERQKQVDKTTEDWIWFLDDDDWWPTKSLEEMVRLVNEADENVDGFSVSPYQVVDRNFHDGSWAGKSFSKWFRNKDINYRHPWPRDMIFSGNKSLYWRHNPNMVKLERKFYHLSNVKGHSFRSEEWAKQFKESIKKRVSYPPECQKDLETIFSLLK